MANRILSLVTTAAKYESYNPAETHEVIMATVRDILGVLDKFPPLVTEKGLITVREWLIQQGIDPKVISQLPAPSCFESQGRE